MTTFTGCGTALVTPFRKDQSMDEETLRKLVRRQIQAGINFLVPQGLATWVNKQRARQRDGTLSQGAAR